MVMKMTKSSGNVFRDLGFDAEESETLQLRSALMAELKRFLREQNVTRTVEVAKLLRISPARASALLNGKFDEFRIDMLVTLAARAGLRIELRIAA